MADVMITSIEKTNTGKYVTASCGTTSAFVSITTDGRIQVCCKNAAHQVWRGAGRSFENIEEAIAGYKSPAMKSIIRAAQTA